MAFLGNPIGNLVSHIRVNKRYHHMKKTPIDPDTDYQWYLFNDFWIQKINQDDAVNFDPIYSTPVRLQIYLHVPRRPSSLFLNMYIWPHMAF